jgi:hypothetical protein
MKKSAALLVSYLLLTATLLVASTSITRYTAVPSNDRIYVRWTASTESQLVRYELHRRTDTENFTLLTTITPTGSGSSYEFTDMNVARIAPNLASSNPTATAQAQPTRYTYMLKVIGSDRTDELQTSLTYQTSNTRRTWGSIKALFR